MPIFEYQCPACGLRAEKIFKVAAESISCPSCGMNAPKVLSDFGFSFANGKVNGNSGVDSLDSSIDKIVGRDASLRWESVKDRESQKLAAIKDANGKPVQRTSEGYKPLSHAQAQRSSYLKKLAKSAE